MAGDDGIYVVGAGLAGLACAHHLLDHGVNATVLEAADGVGGRVRTDVVDGFLLDRGFQMLLTAYPEAKGLLDYRALELHPFSTAALIRMDGRFVKVTDPFRRPLAALSALLAPVGSIRDKLRLARLRRRALREDLATMLARPEAPTGGALAWYGFSPTIVERLFRPLFAGVLMDPGLDASSRMFELALRMLAVGRAAIPSRGMAAIPEQLAAALPGGVHLRRATTKVERGKLTLAGGELLRPAAVVVATDGPSASWLRGERGVADLRASRWPPGVGQRAGRGRAGRGAGAGGGRAARRLVRLGCARLGPAGHLPDRARAAGPAGGRPRPARAPGPPGARAVPVRRPPRQRLHQRRARLRPPRRHRPARGPPRRRHRLRAARSGGLARARGAGRPAEPGPHCSARPAALGRTVPAGHPDNGPAPVYRGRQAFRGEVQGMAEVLLAVLAVLVFMVAVTALAAWWLWRFVKAKLRWRPQVRVVQMWTAPT